MGINHVNNLEMISHTTAVFPALNRRAVVYITLINTASAEGVQSEAYQH